MALTEHISDESFARYAERNISAEETLVVQRHGGGCDVCREKLARIVRPENAFAAVYSSFAFDRSADDHEHLAYEQLEFFVDDKFDEVDREIATSHLAICTECANDLTDLYRFREIAATSGAINTRLNVAEKEPIWSKIFGFGAISRFAPVAAMLVVAVLLGTWFVLRNNDANEIAQGNKGPNVLLSNIGLMNSSTATNVVPETSPSPEAEPSPIDVEPNDKTHLALNDGLLTVDENGNVKGAERLSPASQNAIKQSLRTGNLSIAAHSLGGGGGVLMSGDADNGVPFGLQTPIGKVIKENQPILRWRSLKDAQSYSVAIVDDKFRVVAESGKLTATNWKTSKPLPRGANYSWQVTAISADGTETVSPSSPAPQARFRVVEQNLFDEIDRLEGSSETSHLALGVLYARAGLKREARAEFEKLVKANPNSPIARKLLQSVK